MNNNTKRTQYTATAPYFGSALAREWGNHQRQMAKLKFRANERNFKSRYKKSETNPNLLVSSYTTRPIFQALR